MLSYHLSAEKKKNGQEEEEEGKGECEDNDVWFAGQAGGLGGGGGSGGWQSKFEAAITRAHIWEWTHLALGKPSPTEK